MLLLPEGTDGLRELKGAYTCRWVTRHASQVTCSAQRVTLQCQSGPRCEPALICMLPRQRIASATCRIWQPVSGHLRMAMTPLTGAGKSGNSNRENSPGASGMAKIMECDFHCSRSSIPNSLHAQHHPRSTGMPKSRVGQRTQQQCRKAAKAYDETGLDDGLQLLANLPGHRGERELMLAART